MVLNIYGKLFDFLMIATICLNLSQSKMKHATRKRRASLLWAVYFLVLYILLVLRNNFSWPNWIDYFIISFSIIPPIVFNKTFWPFRFHCSKCGNKLSFSKVIGCDNNYCDKCYSQIYPEEIVQKSIKEEKKEIDSAQANQIDEIDWNNWEPTERCVLNYNFQNDEVLLILKRKGMGEGYINAPGGHIELEETKWEAAIRETKEETGLTPSELKEVGTLFFQFKNGIKMFAYVFFSFSHTGTLIDECDETKPFWCKVKDLDFSKMWADDILWLPEALKGKHFTGYFIFDEKKLIDQKVEFEKHE